MINSESKNILTDSQAEYGVNYYENYENEAKNLPKFPRNNTAHNNLETISRKSHP